MLSLGQRVLVVVTALTMVVNLLIFFPWWLAALGVIALVPFVFAVILK